MNNDVGIETKHYKGITFHITKQRIAVSTPMQFFLIMGVGGNKIMMMRELRQAIREDKISSFPDLFYYLSDHDIEGLVLKETPKLELIASSYQRFYGLPIYHQTMVV